MAGQCDNGTMGLWDYVNKPGEQERMNGCLNG